MIEKLDGLGRLPRLTHLYISNNQIKKFEELLKVAHLPLTDLIMEGNPCYQGLTTEEARLQVLRRLPKLVKLDGFVVTERERTAVQGDDEAQNAP